MGTLTIRRVSPMPGGLTMYINYVTLCVCVCVRACMRSCAYAYVLVNSCQATKVLISKYLATRRVVMSVGGVNGSGR